MESENQALISITGADPLPALCQFVRQLRNKAVLAQLRSRDIAAYEELEHMSFSDLGKIAMETDLVEVRINLDKLEQRIRNMKSLTQEQENVLWLIRNGANKVLIHGIYPAIPDDIVNQQLQFLGSKGFNFSRTKSIPIEYHQTIIHYWYQLQKRNISLIEQWKLLKQEYPQFSLQQLFVVVNKDYV